jgi:hypothetical protein
MLGLKFAFGTMYTYVYIYIYILGASYLKYIHRHTHPSPYVLHGGAMTRQPSVRWG